MECIKNGNRVNFGHGHVYHADRHLCSICGNDVTKTAPRAVYMPDYMPAPFDIQAVTVDELDATYKQENTIDANPTR